MFYWVMFIVVNIVGNLLTVAVFNSVKAKVSKSDWSVKKKSRVLIAASVSGSGILAIVNLAFAAVLAVSGASLWGVVAWVVAAAFHLTSAFAVSSAIAKKARKV